MKEKLNSRNEEKIDHIALNNAKLKSEEIQMDNERLKNLLEEMENKLKLKEIENKLKLEEIENKLRLKEISKETVSTQVDTDIVRNNFENFDGTSQNNNNAVENDNRTRNEFKPIEASHTHTDLILNTASTSILNLNSNLNSSSTSTSNLNSSISLTSPNPNTNLEVNVNKNANANANLNTGHSLFSFVPFGNIIQSITKGRRRSSESDIVVPKELKIMEIDIDETEISKNETEESDFVTVINLQNEIEFFKNQLNISHTTIAEYNEQILDLNKQLQQYQINQENQNNQISQNYKNNGGNLYNGNERNNYINNLYYEDNTENFENFDDVRDSQFIGIQNLNCITASKLVPKQNQRLLQQFHLKLEEKIKLSEDQVVSLEDRLQW